MNFIRTLSVILPLAVFLVAPLTVDGSTVYDNTTGGLTGSINLGYEDKIAVGSEYSTSTTFVVNDVTMFPRIVIAGAHPRMRVSIWKVDRSSDLYNLVGYTPWLDVTNTVLDTPVTFSFSTGVEIIHGYKYMFVAELEQTTSNNDTDYHVNIRTVYSPANNLVQYLLNENLFGDDTIDFNQIFPSQLGMIFNSGISVENYVTMASPCSGDSRTASYVKCQGTYSSSTFDVSGVVHTEDPNMKLEIFFRDVDGDTKDSVSYVYPSPTTVTYDNTFSWSLASSTYNIQVCLVPADSSSIFGSGACVTALWGNGVEPFDPFNIWDSDDGTENTFTMESAWADNGCDDIGITDVFKGVKCALIWGFAPTASALQNFVATKDTVLMVYPIGYATLILADLASTTTSTSTAYFDRDINFGRWFGVETTASTTIDTDALLVHADMGSKIYEMISLLMWIGFVAWLLVFGLTRKL